MTTLYSKKNSPTERPSENAVLSVNDNSSQSKSLQRKADMANAAAQRAEAPRPNNTGMPDNLKSGIESLSGFSMDDVRVHYNSSKPATVQALAYTQGTDIHVAPGQEKHLPHEAWHVAQQMAGRVSPTTNINGMPVNDNAALEHEADVMSEKAVQMKSDERKTVQRATIWNDVAQRVELEDYYYHISKNGISKDIDPMYAINDVTGPRKERDGDDLGPGFYMGDFNCLKAYYKASYIDESPFHIYYIEKTDLGITDYIEGIEEVDPDMLQITDYTEGIEEVDPDLQITDFRKNLDGADGNELFQIAMELGFNGDEKVTRKKPLDLLATNKTEDIEAFNNYVDKKYPNKAVAIKKFFNIAKMSDIWMGYLNDTTVTNGEPQYVQQEDENGKIVKPIQIAIRKIEKIKESLQKMKDNNHIVFWMSELKPAVTIPTTEKPLKQKLKPVLTEIRETKKNEREPKASFSTK